MALDMLTFLLDNILNKFYRTLMGVYLETRVPFFNHLMDEFVLSLIQYSKLIYRQTKCILPQLLYLNLSKVVIEYPNMDFGVLIHSWIYGLLHKCYAQLKISTVGYTNISILVGGK